MPAFRNIAGRRFTRLVAETVVKKGDRIHWRCRCDCGAYCVVSSGNLTSGNTRSCGCLHNEELVQRVYRHGHTVGGGFSLEYQSWRSMIARCTSENDSYWYLYGGRGITVCDRWLSFENFLADMGSRPSKEHTIDRIESERNYEPDNCRWATRDVQVNNRTNTLYVDYRGERLPFAVALRKAGGKVSIKTAWWRIFRGRWTVDKALETPAARESAA
jgi:hypothetical protein